MNNWVKDNRTQTGIFVEIFQCSLPYLEDPYCICQMVASLFDKFSDKTNLIEMKFPILLCRVVVTVHM